jgi:hypothetical protein
MWRIVSGVGRKLRDVLADRIVDREFAVTREQQDGCGGELLGHGSSLEDRVLADRHVVLEIGHAVAFDHDPLAVDGHADRAAWGCRPILREDLVDSSRGGASCRAGHQGEGGRGCDRCCRSQD